MEHKETTRTPYDDMLYLEIACGSPEEEAKCKQILTALKENRTIDRTAYLEGYEAAAEQIFADLGKLLDANFSYNYGIYDGKLGIAILKLKEKYGIK